MLQGGVALVDLLQRPRVRSQQKCAAFGKTLILPSRYKELVTAVDAFTDTFACLYAVFRSADAHFGAELLWSDRRK